MQKWQREDARKRLADICWKRCDAVRRAAREKVKHDIATGRIKLVPAKEIRKACAEAFSLSGGYSKNIDIQALLASKIPLVEDAPVVKKEIQRLQSLRDALQDNVIFLEQGNLVDAIRKMRKA